MLIIDFEKDFFKKPPQFFFVVSRTLVFFNPTTLMFPIGFFYLSSDSAHILELILKMIFFVFLCCRLLCLCPFTIDEKSPSIASF